VSDERLVSVGPAAVLAAVAVALAVVRRSRRLALLGGALVAVELSPPYRAWTTARARARLAAVAEAEGESPAGG
jgi:hypothetical protein